MKLQALASKIHPQVALNQREARHLLSVLQSSFRKQLDVVHPTAESLNGQHATSNSKLSRALSYGSSSSVPRTSRSSAHQHLDTLLTNPLFMPVHVDLGRSHNETLAVIKDPVAWFSNRVAQGSADGAAARLCLNMLLSLLSKTPTGPVELKEALSKAKGGTRVIEWMWAYGVRDLSEMQKDPELLALLIKPLIAEGRRAILEKWFLDPSVARKTGWRRLLFERILRAEMALGTDLTQVIYYFWHMAKHLGTTAAEDSHLLGSVTKTAGLFLTLQLISQSSAVNPSIYTRWMESVGDWSDNPAFYTALLDIHHPETPDTGAALKYLRGETYIKEKPQKMVRLCLDSAELLLSQENYTAATWVMDYAKSHYATELGFKAKEDAPRQSIKTTGNKKFIQHDNDERQHVELLEQLSFG